LVGEYFEDKYNPLRAYIPPKLQGQREFAAIFFELLVAGLRESESKGIVKKKLSLFIPSDRISSKQRGSASLPPRNWKFMHENLLQNKHVFNENC
jgi:hypothetical protein